ncbi:MAG: TIGR02117 family protein [Sphingobacteriales bacterium]|nr:MAG: TIGR02117 family protein [Sphingobacteriales bacterium]
MKKKKSLLRRILKAILIFVLCFIGGILLYLGIEAVLSRIKVNGMAAQEKELSIYIINNGAHTDIVMPVQSPVINWSEWIPYENTLGKDSSNSWIAMGWGDKGFYLETETWADLKPSVAINAAFGLSTTAIHATYYKEMKEGERCRKIDLSLEQYRNLVAFIQNSFQTDETGKYKYVPTDKQYSANDAFYDAKGSYSMLHTCNTWANNALKAAGLKACKWTAFYTGIFKKYPLQ